MKTKEK